MGMPSDTDLFGNETTDSLHPNMPIVALVGNIFVAIAKIHKVTDKILCMAPWTFLYSRALMFLFFSQTGVRPLCLSVSYT